MPVLLRPRWHAAPEYREELIFPLNSQHNHAPGIVECTGGELLVSWYRGSGERSADDVAVLGSRMARGAVRGASLSSWPTTPSFRIAIPA